MRLFIAAYLPAEVERHFAAMVGTLAVARPMPEGQSVRLVPAEQWHMTLAFVGEVDDARKDDAVEVMGALPALAPEVRIGGGGRFGRGKFTTLVAKVDGDVAPLGDAVRKLLQETAAAVRPQAATAARDDRPGRATGCRPETSMPTWRRSASIRDRSGRWTTCGS